MIKKIFSGIGKIIVSLFLSFFVFASFYKAWHALLRFELFLMMIDIAIGITIMCAIFVVLSKGK